MGRHEHGAAVWEERMAGEPREKGFTHRRICENWWERWAARRDQMSPRAPALREATRLKQRCGGWPDTRWCIKGASRRPLLRTPDLREAAVLKRRMPEEDI